MAHISSLSTIFKSNFTKTKNHTQIHQRWHYHILFTLFSTHLFPFSNSWKTLIDRFQNNFTFVFIIQLNCRFDSKKQGHLRSKFVHRTIPNIREKGKFRSRWSINRSLCRPTNIRKLRKIYRPISSARRAENVIRLAFNTKIKQISKIFLYPFACWNVSN